jgi:hypothetical protein
VLWGISLGLTTPLASRIHPLLTQLRHNQKKLEFTATSLVRLRGSGRQLAALNHSAGHSAGGKWMTMIQDYTQSILVPRLHSLGLTKRQRDIVAKDVTQRLESLLYHWSDVPFRRTVLAIGTEEATFWEPSSASVEIRSLVVVAVRNSLLTDLNATLAYTKALRSRAELLPDSRMPWITGEAIKYFQAANLDAVQVQPESDMFGSLPGRFPNAWHVLSLLGNSPEREIACNLPMTEAEPMDFSARRAGVLRHTVIESGMDPGLDDFLADVLRKIERQEVDLFFSSCFKGITRNPEKLLSILDHVLRFGGTVLTPNYLLSPTYLSRRHPLLRPAHFSSEISAQLANPEGLSDRHRKALAEIV